MWLGQAHRARPFAADHLGQVGLLQRVVGIDLDRGDRPVGEARVEAERIDVAQIISSTSLPTASGSPARPIPADAAFQPPSANC
jgi:hypothetical protein